MNAHLIETLASGVHALAWSIYVGGAIMMEFVLRHAQKTMRPSQVAIVCQNAGRRYRWWSCLCLTALLLTGLILAAPREAESKVLLAITGIVWLFLAAILALLSFYIHPEMHIRVSPSMSAAEVAQERQRVKRAIGLMDLAVRVELGLTLFAVALGVGMHSQEF